MDDIDFVSESAMRSRHYMAFVGQFPGVVTMLKGEPQESRTTVHHIVKRGVAKKGPDWWSVPVSLDRHVHGDRSVDKLGKSQFRETWDLPSYERMASVFLRRYLEEGAYGRTFGKTDPEGDEKKRARAYLRLLTRLIQNGKSAKSWNW
jgi:hypothetical protein